MNRGRSQRHTNQQYNNQIDVFGRHDPFREMNQIMRSFGGFGSSMFQDDFFKNDFMMRPFEDPIQSMMNFSNMHQKAHQGGKNGSYVSQTFVSSSTLGSDGKINKQSYYQNNMGQHRNGQTISQKQQAYKNNQGVKRMAEERMLNDKGHKIMREKKGNQIEQSTNYYNIDEDEVQNFHNSWENANKEMRFLENHSRQMKGIQNGRNEPTRQLGIGYEPHHPQQNKRISQQNNNNSHNRRQESREMYSTKGSQRGSEVPSTRGSRKY